MTYRSILPALLAPVILFAAGCAGGNDSAGARQQHPNVLLVIVDTLRADKLGCYGSELRATPQIDSLASRSVRFASAYAHAPWTLPSIASLLTSQYPNQHKAGGYLMHFSKLAEANRTLAENLRDAGYRTAAIVNVDFLTAAFGMTQGFDHVDFEAYPDNIHMRNAGRTTDAALEWLGRNRSQPFLLMVHYFDPHATYDPPEEFRRAYAADEDKQDSSWTFGTREQIIAALMGRTHFDRETIRRAERLYDGEVAYTDSEVGRLLDGLDGLSLMDDTVVVFTADHGEEFLDHGGIEHGHTLYEELVHVPLLISWPGRLKPLTVSATVGLVDLAPTLCDLTGVEPDPAFVGRSLTPYLGAPGSPGRTILTFGNFWGPPLWSWRSGNYKLIVEPRRRPKLFDLSVDPGESNDLSRTEPARVAAMLGDMRLAAKAMQARSQGEELAVDLTPEQLERLRSLGYLR